MSASNADLGNVKEEPRLPSNPYLQQFDDIRSAVITELDAPLATPAALRELNAAIKPLWDEASRTVRVKKSGSQYHSHIMMIEFEHSVPVKDLVEKLVKTKAKDKEQKRTDLLEGLILLKQLKHYSLHRPEFSSTTGCVPAWYQQISGDNGTTSGVTDYIIVLDNEETDITDVDAMDRDESAVAVIRTPVKSEQARAADRDNNDDKDASISTTSTITEQWIGRDGETYTGDLIDGQFHGYGTYTCATYGYTGEFSNSKMHGQGEIVYSNGDKYKGQFAKHVMHGHGEHTTSAFKYVGEYRDGNKHGLGDKC
jgi:hypothetical protein